MKASILTKIWIGIGSLKAFFIFKNNFTEKVQCIITLVHFVKDLCVPTHLKVSTCISIPAFIFFFLLITTTHPTKISVSATNTTTETDIAAARVVVSTPVLLSLLSPDITTTVGTTCPLLVVLDCGLTSDEEDGLAVAKGQLASTLMSVSLFEVMHVMSKQS